MHLTCRFHRPISGRILLQDAIKAVDLGLRPVDLPGRRLEPVPVYVSAAAGAKLANVVEKSGLRHHEAVSQLAYALECSIERERSKTSTEDVSENTALRRAMTKAIVEGVDAKQIVLAEGSTGLGKSRILGDAARHILDAKKGNVVWVAVPTISVMLQMLEEFAQVRGLVAPEVLIGRQQFVSERRLCDALEEMAADGEDVSGASQRVAEWIKGGCLPASDSTRRMANLIPGLHHLHEDLAHVAPELRDLRCSLLTGDQAEPAELLRESISGRARDPNCRFVLCTHAMLVLESMTTPHEEALPFTHVIVDEAHELEDVAARLAGADISLLSLRSWFKKAKLARSSEAVQLINALIGDLRENGELAARRLLPERVSNEVHAVLHDLDDLLAGARKADAERGELRAELAKIFKGGTKWTRVDFSPVRRYPSINFGPSNVGFTMQGIWDRVDAAVLVSATIWIPNFTVGESGIAETSPGFVQNKLALPAHRLRKPLPFVASWVTSSPTLMTPSSDQLEKFCYPGMPEIAEEGEELTLEEKSQVQSYSDWVDNCTTVILEAAKTAAGGTLILCNSFADIGQIHLRLAQDLGRRLVVHRKNYPTAAQRSDFIALHRSGVRPVWIATGPAWTGLNLSDSEAASATEDRLLTDLMILRAPFGLARSSTHYGRCAEQNRWKVIMWETGIRMRQGVGRLIRRNGLEQRRIWMLDARLWHPSYRRVHSMRTLFHGYTKTAPFKI